VNWERTTGTDRGEGRLGSRVNRYIPGKLQERKEEGVRSRVKVNNRKNDENSRKKPPHLGRKEEERPK